MRLLVRRKWAAIAHSLLVCYDLTLPEVVTTLPVPLATSDSDILGGEPVFAGTRVPVKTLFDYLAENQTLSAYLDDFPGV